MLAACLQQALLSGMPHLGSECKFLSTDAVVKDFIASPAALMPGLAPDADLLNSCPEGLSLPAESLAIPHSSSRNYILFGMLSILAQPYSRQHI